MDYTRRMQNFEKRRDRFDAFNAFENPLINLSFELDLPDFRPWCKAHQLPPFHFLLYCVLTTVREHDNFLYRIYEGEVIKIDEFFGSYTVINQDNNLNYTRFTMSADMNQFIARSIAARQVAETSGPLVNTAAALSPREQKNHIFITCLPWLRLSAIEHPIFHHHGADIPSIAWGKFGEARLGRMALPFSVQAHHGFVDGHHIHQLTEAVGARIARLIA